MNTRRVSSGLLYIVVLAFVGFVLMYVPGKIAEQYEIVSKWGSTWATIYFCVVGVGATLLVCSALWIVWTLWRRGRKKAHRRQERNKNPSQLSRGQQEKEIDENLASVEDLQLEAEVSDELKEELAPLVRQIETKRENRRLEIVAFGTISSGKSSLLNALAGREVFQTDAKGGTTGSRNEIPWPGLDKVSLVDTPGLGEVDGAEHVAIASAAAKDAELILVVVDGPLRESEFHLLKQLGSMEKRVLICLNKEDWYSENEKAVLLDQIVEQVKDFTSAEDVVAVRAAGGERSRVRLLPDGSEVEETIEALPDIAPLAKRMMQIVRRDGEDLLLANLLLQSRGLIEEARTQVRDALDRRAWEIVDRHMWGAAGAAALSPFPMIDLAAGGAISTKMVLDLARVYRQDVDLNTAIHLIGQLGKQLLAILGASAATPLVASGVASLLKTVPGAGTIAGGLLQGIVQALVTRWIGAVFIQYYKNEMQQPEGGLAAMARREWQRITSVAELRKILEQARSHFRGDRE